MRDAALKSGHGNCLPDCRIIVSIILQVRCFRQNSISVMLLNDLVKTPDNVS
jgi:hypothetical protein